MEDAPSAPGHEMGIRFVGSGSEYFRIWVVNLLLTLATLGLYYPYAKLRRLRYFHGVTEVGGTPLSFDAEPARMLRGHLLVALMLVVYIGAGQVSVIAGVVAFGTLSLLWPALWHQSMRFRLAHTSWRGLRLRYTGTVRDAYAAMAVPIGAGMLIVLLQLAMSSGEPLSAYDVVFWDALPVLGLGLLLLLLPLSVWLLKRLQHSSYALGNERTRYAAGPGAFYALALRTLGVSVLVTAAGLLALGALAFLVMGMQTLVRWWWFLGPAGASVVGIGSYLVAFSMVGGYWTARLQNLVWGHTGSARLRFVSTLRARSLVGLWLKNTLLVLLTLGLYWPFAQVASARLRLQSIAILSSVDPDELTGAGRTDEGAAGEAAGDLFGLDIGL